MGVEPVVGSEPYDDDRPAGLTDRVSTPGGERGTLLAGGIGEARKGAAVPGRQSLLVTGRRKIRAHPHHRQASMWGSRPSIR